MNAKKKRSEIERVWCHHHSDWFAVTEHMHERRGLSTEVFGKWTYGENVYLIPDDPKVIKTEVFRACDSGFTPKKAFHFPWVWVCGECGEEYHFQQSTEGGYSYWLPNEQIPEEKAQRKAEDCCLIGRSS